MSTDAKTPPPPEKALSPIEARRLTLRGFLQAQRPELSKLLPAGMRLDRLERMALTECVKNPKLLDCTAESWALAIQTCAQQGLYPDSGLGYMYLIPRNNRKKVGNEWKAFLEVTAQRGYQGDIQLARNTGEIADIYAEVVYDKDEYKVKKGLDRDITHNPYVGDEDPGALKAVYAVAKLRSGEVAFVTLSKRDVERHKKSAQGLDRDDSPWNAHEASMWKKTAIHELFKWLPKASEAMDKAVRTVLGDEPREAQVINMGQAVIPSEPRAEGLADLTARLEDSQTPGCDHPKAADALRAVPKGAAWPCPDCGEELVGTKEPEESGKIVSTPAPVATAAPGGRKLLDPKTCPHKPLEGWFKRAAPGQIGICDDCDAEIHKEPPPEAAAPATVAEIAGRRKTKLGEGS